MCGKVGVLGRGKGSLVKHHVSYYPEKILILCRSCHAKWHWTHRGERRTPRIDDERAVKWMIMYARAFGVGYIPESKAK